MKKKTMFILIIIIIILLTSAGCSFTLDKKSINNNIDQKNNITRQTETDKNENHLHKNQKHDSGVVIVEVTNKYKDMSPNVWDQKLDGIVSRIDTEDNVIALTFDACGGNRGNGYDSKLIDYLIKENVAATLFLNARWIDENLNTFHDLSANPLFEIENHGYKHKPVSINGKSAYHIQGTKNIEELINEVHLNEQKIQDLTGRKPHYFRSGTAYYDNVAVAAIRDLGEKPVNFNINGDGGATYSIEQIKKASLEAKSGSIIIYHMNHPEKNTAEGLMEVIPLLKKEGYQFVKLEDYDAHLK